MFSVAVLGRSLVKDTHCIALLRPGSPDTVCGQREARFPRRTLETRLNVGLGLIVVW